jgi:DNA-binding IclR family transcriptional regulator
VARVSSGESVLGRAVRILEAFTSEDPVLRVSEIARRADLHVATASRLVAELVTYGLLTRDPQGGLRVGVRLWELAARASPALSLREAAMPLMEDLHAVAGHHTQLGVLDGTEVLFIERLSAPRAVINLTQIAGRLSLHASSSGLVLLAYAPRPLQQRVLSQPLKPYTPSTIVSPAQLREVLAGIRRQGFVLCAGHIHEDATGIAVPVRDGSGDVVAALSVIVPNDATAHAQIPALMAASRGVTRRLPGPAAQRLGNLPETISHSVRRP